MNKRTSLGNRAIALLLSIVMILGMLPVSVFAAEDDSIYGKVESLTNGITITDSGATQNAVYAGTLNWIAADPSVGRVNDGWWAGIKVTAPATMNLETAQYTSGGQTKSFKEFKDSKDGDETHFITFWGLINEEYLRAANLTDGLATYTYTFDWDGDGTFEQTVCLEYDADKVTLVNELGTTVYPAQNLGYGKLDMLTPGATITGNETGAIEAKYDSKISLAWVAADPSIGRYQDGWWAGMKLTVPAGMTQEQLEAAQFMMGNSVYSFWENKNSKDTDSVHFMDMWIPLNNLLSGNMKPYTLKFDWNNDGIFEQSVTMSVDPNMVTLTKDGKQMYPVLLGNVSTYTGGTVTGSGTADVNVKITNTTLNWSVADGRAAWWVGIKVVAPSGMTTEMLQAVKYQSKSGPNEEWSAAKSFWNNKDSENHIEMWFPINHETIEKFKAENRNMTTWYQFDWNDDGTYEQAITFEVDPNGVVLNPKAQTGFAFDNASPENIWIGEGTYQNVAAGGESDGAVTYEIVSGDATVDGNGLVTFNAAGPVTVKATKAGDAEGFYSDATAEYTITAVKNTQTPAFAITAPSTLTYEPGMTFENAITNVAEGTEVTYAITEGTDVADIDEATGKLTIKKAGTITVEALIKENANYFGTTETYTLVIDKADQSEFAFENAPANLTWQSAAIEALNVVNGLGTGEVIWSVVAGNDVASVAADGTINLLKAGTFTIQAQKAGDDCYNASAEITATIIVGKADQTGFGFSKTEDTVTYNDNGNKYTLAATGGQSSKATEYIVINGDAVSVDNNGVVTILKAGTVTIQATKPADDQYNEITATYKLTINPDTQEFTFANGAANAVLYGTKEYTNTVVFADKYSANSALVYELAPNELGATIDAATGKITFADSAKKVDTLTVTATKAADECYSAYSASYTLDVSYLVADAAPVVDGAKINDSGWFTGDVVINAPEGYQISYSNELSTADWSDKVSFDTEGGNKTAVVYLKNADGFMTKAIEVPGINLDTVDPENLKIKYATPAWQVLLENVTFGIYKADKLNVTISASDASSGIASLTYNIGGEDVVVEFDGEASASHSFSIDAQYRNSITLTAEDVSGRKAMLKDEVVLVLDTNSPKMNVAFDYASGAYRMDNEILYTQDAVTLNFVIDEENFDLSGLEIIDSEGQKTGEKTGVPVVTINNNEKTVTWTRVENTTKWEGSLTLSDDGDYVVAVTIVDAAGNEMLPYNREIHIDRAAPVIAVSYDNNVANNGNFYDAKRIAEIKVTDHNFKAEDVELTITAKDITGADVDLASKGYAAYAKNPANWTQNGDEWTLDVSGMKLDLDGIYAVEVAYADLAGNAAEFTDEAFVIDTKIPENITIEYSEPVIEKIFETLTFGFYKSNVVVTVTAEDKAAGVDFFEITYNQDAGANVDSTRTYTEKIDAVQDADDKKVFTATHTIKAGARGNISVEVTDNAGNVGAKSDSKTLVTDTIAPGVNVEYIFTNEQNNHYNNIYYTQGETKVRFTVTEANFDLTLLTAADETSSKAPVVTVNNVAQNVEWTQITGENKWVGEIVLSGNGDYVVSMTFADRSGNKMETFSKEIHIDDVAPVFEVTYDNNNASNENKYKADRTATVKVTEHNFLASEVDLTVTATDITGAVVDIDSKEYAEYAKNPDNWTQAGDVWTLKTDGMLFDIDAIYHVELAYTDLAENKAEAYTADFVIDKTQAYDIEIAYSDSVAGKLLEKLFYNADVTVTVTAKDMTAGVESFTLTYTKQEGASAINLATFTTDPLTAKQDATNKNVFTASYKIPASARGTVSVSVLDEAGNTSFGKDTTLVVVDNVDPTREVIYTPYKILDAATMLEVGAYAEGDDSILYYQGDATVTFKITEANFDLSLENEVDKPVIMVNETPVEVQWTEAENDVWVATHTIEDDGDYVVTMTYKDMSTNQMTRYESCDIVIDGTAPVIDVKYADGASTQEIAGTKYYKTTQDIAVTITDHNFRADDVVVTVTAKDVQGNPVDISAKAYADYAKDRANWTSVGDVHTLNTAGMVMDTDAIYTFDIVYDDICDNMASDYADDHFVVDHAAPTGLKITYSTPIVQKVISTLTFGFYQPSVTVTLNAEDATAGVDYFEWNYTKEDGTSNKNAESYGGKITSDEITYTNEGKSAEASFVIPANARGYITASATDRSGNSTEDLYDETDIKVVDDIAPAISVTYAANADVQYIDENGATVDTFGKAVNAFYNGNVTAKIVIDEANFFEGVTAADGVIHQIGIKLTKTDDNGNVTVTEYLPAGATQKYAEATPAEISWTSEGDIHVAVIPYEDNADYVLEITCADLSTNDAVIAANDGQTVTGSYVSKIVTVDKIAPVIKVAYENHNVINNIDSRDYFDKTQSAVITVTEHNFRASDVKAVVNAVNFLNAKVAVADFAAQLADEKNWTHNGNVHTAKVEYTVDANYTFDIDFKDLAQNASADYKTDLFTVDTTAPTNLTVTYSTNVFQEVLQALTFGYYNAPVTVTITADDVTSGIHHFAYSYINSANVSSVNAELLNEAIAAAKIAHENATGTATFRIPKEALTRDNQFNGTVEFTAYDRSENSTTLKDSTRIVVDNISPTATVTYNNPVQIYEGTSFYDGNIEVTINITEANFDSDDVVVTVTKDGANHAVNVAWRDNNVDSHTGSFVLTEDGDYFVSVQYTDKSGNQMAAYTSNELTLDTIAPTIKASKIKANSANKDETYGFVIEFSDINLDVETMEPVLKAVKKNAAGVYETVEIDLGKATAVVNGETYTYTVENLPDDGLYTLTCEVQDMSANRTTTIGLDDGQSYNEVQFSINRDGSVFAYGNEFTAALVNKYYVYSVDEDVVILEINVDPIENYSVSLNGKELVAGTDYTTEQTSNAGEWSKRTYSINKELFEAEGEYNLIITSTDKAETTAFSDIKNLTLAFVVDQTSPVVVIAGLESGGRYQTDAQTVTLMPTDEGGRLNSLVVLVLDSDGNPLKDEFGNDISVRFEMSGEELLEHLEANDGKIVFTVPEGLNNKVQIICDDCAVNAMNETNEYNELFENVTVSQNQLVIFYANKPAFYGTIGGTVSLAALVIFLIKRKKLKI